MSKAPTTNSVNAPSGIEAQIGKLIETLRRVCGAEAQRAVFIAVLTYFAGWAFAPIWWVGYPVAAWLFWTARVVDSDAPELNHIVAPVSGRRARVPNDGIRITPGLFDSRVVRAPATGQIADVVAKQATSTLRIQVGTGATVTLIIDKCLTGAVDLQPGRKIEVGEILGTLAPFAGTEVHVSSAVVQPRPKKLRAAQTRLWSLTR